MIYSWKDLTVEKITNLFLYGVDEVPADLGDDKFIRSANKGVEIEVDVKSFMYTGPGRFARGSQSEMVSRFFDERGMTI